MDAKGFFYEWSTYHEFSIGEKSAALITGTLGLNDGYVSDGNDGANFYALSAQVDRKLSDNYLVFCHVMQSFAIDRDLTLAGDDQLEDFFHFGLGLQLNF